MKSKPWYKSKGVMGGVVAVLVLIAGLFGYQVGPEAQQEIVTSLIAIAGAGVAIYGRVKAVDKIRK